MPPELIPGGITLLIYTYTVFIRTTSAHTIFLKVVRSIVVSLAHNTRLFRFNIKGSVSEIGISMQIK